MEIIKRGDKNQAECYGCGSVLGFRVEDIRHQWIGPEGPYEIEGFDKYTIKCPSCETTISVNSKITYAIGNRVLQLEQTREREDWDF